MEFSPRSGFTSAVVRVTLGNSLTPVVVISSDCRHCEFLETKESVMKIRQLAAIGLLLAFGCQAGDSSSGPSSEAESTTSVTDPGGGQLAQVNFDVTGMR